MTIIERIVKEKIVDPPIIRKHTITCGEKEILLTHGKFSKEELELIFQDTKRFISAIYLHIEPLPYFPKIEILFHSDFILSIRGQSQWHWRS